MTGWRVGWLIGPTDVVKAATNLQSHATSNVSNVAQVAALAAVPGDLSAVAEMREAFDRRRQTIVRMLNEIAGVELPGAAGRVLRLPVGQGRCSARRSAAGARSTSAELAELDPRRGRGRGGARARRSAPRATCGCPTRWATTTWSRASRRHPQAARRGPLSTEQAVTVGRGTCARCRRRICTCTSPGRCGRRRCVELAAEHGVRLPDALRRAASRRELRATDERGWFRFQRLYDIARSVSAASRRHAPAGARGRRGRARRRARAGWRSRSTRPSYAPRLGGLTPTARADPRRRREAAARPPGSASA